jgi:hypothetical protein
MAIHRPKTEECGNVRIITLRHSGIRDLENMLARDLETCGETPGSRHLLLDFTTWNT